MYIYIPYIYDLNQTENPVKKKLLVSILMLPAFCLAQLEHTYDGGNVSRVVLENSGEKYYVLNKAASRVEFYNADHTPWKNVPVDLPTPVFSFMVWHVSETKINPDPNIEILYSTRSASADQSKIVNELGETLLTVANCQAIRLDQIEGLQDKVIARNGDVYSLPQLTMEHHYDGEPSRIQLESSGEKYYVFNRVGGVVSFYNADHSFWKAVTLDLPSSSYFTFMEVFWEHQINTDDLIEIGYGYAGGSAPGAKIINENNQTLLSVAGAERLRLNRVSGLDNVVFADRIPDINAPMNMETDVFRTADLTLEHTYPGYMQRTKLENSGEKYYTERSNPEASEIVVYNADHTPWKSIAVPIITPWQSIEGVSISENKVDSDNEVEFLYTVSSNTLDGGSYVSNLVQENGTVSLTIEHAYGLSLSEYPNLATKLIAQIEDGPSFEFTHYLSQVYALNGLAVQDFDRSVVSVAPNPARTTIQIQSTAAITSAQIFDLRGILVSKISGTEIKTVDVSGLSTGIYGLVLQEVSGQKHTQKITIE